MHASSSIRRFAAGAAVVIFSSTLLALVGCPKQEDFPAALDLVAPPTPTDFDITNTGTAYSFAWTISDPTDVDHYLIRILGQGVLADEVIAETTDNPFAYNPGISLAGLQFAVSSVSTQGVEGGRAVATAE
jgi:hypothetical protein